MASDAASVATMAKAPVASEVNVFVAKGPLLLSSRKGPARAFSQNGNALATAAADVEHVTD